MSAQKCPARAGCRRKKVLYCFLLGAFFIGVLQLVGIPGDYSSPMPLQDAHSEARRLLKFITQYHVQCNLTLQVSSSNRSHWPLCIDRDLGIDLDSKTPKAGLVLGTQYDLDFSTEQYLTANDSFHFLLVSESSSIAQMNNSFSVNSIIVPNDPADFGRNSYDQMTMNTLLQRYGVQRLDLMRLAGTANDINMWEMLHFMSEDDLLLKVQQLHVAMYIDKLDEDLLYNWYRTLHSLFYTQGMRLYHTSSRDPLCLQVTLMESCMYFLSFIRDPGPRFFVMYPPADFGAIESEQRRLVEYMDAPSEKCSTQSNIGHSVICHSLVHAPCTFFLFRSSYSHKNDAAYFNKIDCDIHILVPQANEVFMQYSFFHASSMLLSLLRESPHGPQHRIRHNYEVNTASCGGLSHGDFISFTPIMIIAGK